MLARATPRVRELLDGRGDADDGLLAEPATDDRDSEPARGTCLADSADPPEGVEGSREGRDGNSYGMSGPLTINLPVMFRSTAARLGL